MKSDILIIIGAPRSGTNMLRDLLTSMPEFATWPCDEINYIWRHGNARYQTDEFSVKLASPDVCFFINGCFERIAEKYSCITIVEKTCANSLRVGFVDKVVPEAKFIFLYRDGRDAVLSTMKRWIAPLDIPYVLKKARFVPFSDLPYYGFRYLKNRFQKIISRENRLSSWGPRFEGMDEMVESKSLLEICAVQWARCVEKSLDDLGKIDTDRIHSIKYEDFVMNPKQEICSLAPFLNINLSDYEVENMIRNVNPKSVGNWKQHFVERDLSVLEPLISAPMKRLGYH